MTLAVDTTFELVRVTVLVDLVDEEVAVVRAVVLLVLVESVVLVVVMALTQTVRKWLHQPVASYVMLLHPDFG